MAAARQALASMLDELMGKHRNALPSERPPDYGFEDSEVCKYYLAGFCHHELFTNTKADLGPCGNLHDEKLREQYRTSSKFEKLGYEDEFLTALQSVQNDMQRRIIRNRQRLELTQPGGNAEDASQDKVQTRVDSLSEKITAMLEQAETLGTQGRVEDAQKLIEKTEELKEERDRCRKTLDAPIAELKEMEVCDTCGCFLVIGDSKHRLDEHMMGKQHMGFAKVNATIEELVRRKEERRRTREEEYRKEMEKQRRDDGHRRHRHNRRSRSRSRDRYRRQSRTDRDADESRHRYGSRIDRRASDREYELSRRHSSSSRHSAHDRHHRSRSPKRHRTSKSPCEENGSTRWRDSESGTDGQKVNISPNRVSITTPSNERPGTSHDDDEDEEGLIRSSSDE